MGVLDVLVLSKNAKPRIFMSCVQRLPFETATPHQTCSIELIRIVKPCIVPSLISCIDFIQWIIKDKLSLQ